MVIEGRRRRKRFAQDCGSTTVVGARSGFLRATVRATALCTEGKGYGRHASAVLVHSLELLVCDLVLDDQMPAKKALGQHLLSEVLQSLAWQA